MRDITRFKKIDIKDLNLPIRYKNGIITIMTKLLNLKDELNIRYLFLFGSCSRGDIRYDSDIDILLLTTSENEKDIRCKLIYEEIDTKVFNITPQITVRNINNYCNINDNVKFHDLIYKDLKLLWKGC